MEWNIMWVPWTDVGLEHLHLSQDENGIIVDSVVIGMADEKPFRVWYTIHADLDWKVRRCILHLLGSESQEIMLQAESEGQWRDANALPLPALDGCIDVDISITPFTNTLPIRRLSLTPGQSADLLVAYLSIPEMKVRPMSQRYTCLESHTEGGLYRYENLDGSFTRDLPIDAQGLVIEYPGLWRRAGLSGSSKNFSL